jgi:hypothetical protein
MESFVDACAVKLHALLTELFATDVPIVHGLDTAVDGAVLRVDSRSYGDPYSGYVSVDVISLEGFVPLKLAFSYSLHLQQRSWWNPSVSPIFRFNGVAVSF